METKPESTLANDVSSKNIPRSHVCVLAPTNDYSVDGALNDDLLLARHVGRAAVRLVEPNKVWHF